MWLHDLQKNHTVNQGKVCTLNHKLQKKFHYTTAIVPSHSVTSHNSQESIFCSLKLFCNISDKRNRPGSLPPTPSIIKEITSKDGLCVLWSLTSVCCQNPGSSSIGHSQVKLNESGMYFSVMSLHVLWAIFVWEMFGFENHLLKGVGKEEPREKEAAMWYRPRTLGESHTVEFIC